MLTGSCLCGTIRYELQQNIEKIVFCHCTRCQKQTGSAFNSAAMIEKKTIFFTQGEACLKMFSYQGVNRHFCGLCGSHLLSSRDNDSIYYRLRIGSLNEPIYPLQKCHIYTASKASWDEICDNNPQYPEMIE